MATKVEIKYLHMIKGLQALTTNLSPSQSFVHAQLDEMRKDVKTRQDKVVLMKIILHIGDISRHHNLLKELNINSKTGGQGLRETFRHCLTWMEKIYPEDLQKYINVFVDFTVLDNFMYYQNTTDRKTGKLLKTDIQFPVRDAFMQYLKSRINKGVNTPLVARHLPKFPTGLSRTTKIKGPKTVKIPKNAKSIWLGDTQLINPKGQTNVPEGKVLKYIRPKQAFTLQKDAKIRKWIYDFCEVMGWTLQQYKEFRKTQNTAEQQIPVLSEMTQEELFVFFDRLTTGQFNRIQRMLMDQRGVARPEWGKVSQAFFQWQTKQNEVAQELREAFHDGDTEKQQEAAKKMKVKQTGVKTIDILKEMFKSNDPTIANTKHQALIEKMDLEANVFPIIDGSGSMSQDVDGSGHWNRSNTISCFDLAATLLITFSTRHPNPAFRNTYGWFSSNFYIVGESKYVYDNDNPYLVQKPKRKVKGVSISPKKTFSENFKIIKSSNPGSIASTNMYAVIETFVKLVKDGKFHVEDLPNALLFITDNEYNTGKSPAQAAELANSIGWNPLFIYWGIVGNNNVKSQMEGTPNCLFTSGFSEGTLTQILRGIKTGSVSPDMQIIAIAEDVRYSVIV